MAEYASGVRVKIKRAKQHIANLERRTNGFFQPAPYKLVTENKTEGGTRAVWRRVPGAKNIPPIWGAIAGDAIHNLRSALDVLWRQATNPRPGKTDRRKGAHFPFLPAEELEARLRRVKEPALKSAFAIAKTFEPYESGNYELWLLNEASAIDKHEVPIVVACAYQTGKFTLGPPPFEPDGFSFEIRPTPRRPFLVEDGKEFFTDQWGRHLKADDDDQFTFTIAFGECGPLKDQTVLPTLGEFARIVKAIARAFQQEGLIR